MRRGRITIPPRQRACIHAAKDMLGAVIAAGKRAQKRLEIAERRHGRLSDAYLAERAGYEETQRLIDGWYPFLLDRISRLEAPFQDRGE